MEAKITLQKLDEICIKIEAERKIKKDAIGLYNGNLKELIAKGIWLARTYLNSKIDIIIPGDVYNIYECGHVFNSKEDPSILKYFQSSGTRKRGCPALECHPNIKTRKDPQRLVAKYKICSCGVERLSNKVSPSKSCKNCYKPEEPKEDAKREYRMKLNEKLRDISRSDCVHYLSKCIMKYDGCQCVPCKGCRDYEIGSGGINILDFSERRISV